MDGEEFIKRAYEAILKSDFEQAIACFEQAIALEPDNANFHYKLSITCARSNRLAVALEHAKAAMRLAPDDPSFRFHHQSLMAREKVAQAEALLRKGKEQFYLAAAFLKEAVRLDPLSLEAKLLLGYVCGELEDYHEAIAILKEADRLHPHHEEIEKVLKEYTRRMRRMLGSG